MSNLLFHNFDKSNDDIEDFNSTASNIISTRDNGLINDGNGSETDTRIINEQYMINEHIHMLPTTPTKTQNNIINMHVLTVESII